MAFRGNKYAMAVKVQSAVDTPATVNNTTDLLLCYDIQPGGDVYTLTNPESTGSVDRPPDAVLGRSASVSFNMIIRGPGGASPPAADAWTPGRLLRAARFTEISQAAPMFTAAALVSATGQDIVLPAAASAVDDAYNGLPLQIANQGTGVKQLSFIRDYIGSSKTAVMAETFGTTPSGNVTVPAFLGYRYDAAAPELYLSLDYWLDKKRYKMVNGVVSSRQFNFNVSNNGDTAFTYISFTVTGDVHPTTPEIDEDSPLVGQGGAMPVFRDADWWLANKSICGSGLVVDQAIQTARAPCPTKASGGEAPSQVSVTRTATPTINEVLLSVEDYNLLADGYAGAGTMHGHWLMYGNSTGKTVMYGIPDAGIGYSNAAISGEFVTRQPALLIPATSLSESLVFPYY